MSTRATSPMSGGVPLVPVMKSANLRYRDDSSHFNVTAHPTAEWTGQQLVY